MSRARFPADNLSRAPNVPIVSSSNAKPFRFAFRVQSETFPAESFAEGWNPGKDSPPSADRPPEGRVPPGKDCPRFSGIPAASSQPVKQHAIIIVAPLPFELGSPYDSNPPAGGDYSPKNREFLSRRRQEVTLNGNQKVVGCGKSQGTWGFLPIKDSPGEILPIRSVTAGPPAVSSVRQPQGGFRNKRKSRATWTEGRSRMNYLAFLWSPLPHVKPPIGWKLPREPII